MMGKLYLYSIVGGMISLHIVMVAPQTLVMVLLLLALGLILIK